MKSKLNKRMLSALLALLLFLSCVPISRASAEEGVPFYITLDGTAEEYLELFSNEKKELLAEGLEEATDYQWQILHPENEDLWINIYDAKTNALPVTHALVGNMLNGDAQAHVRCRAVRNGETFTTEAFCIQLLEGIAMPEPVALAEETEAVEEAAEAAEPEDGQFETIEPETVEEVLTFSDSASGIAFQADGTGEIPEFVKITIEYKRYGYVRQPDGDFEEELIGDAFSPYVATLKSMTTLNKSVHCPTIIGYEPSLVSVTENGVSRSAREDEFNNETKEVNINQTEVTSDVLYQVQYRPADVNYEVRYYFQNIYDDLYIEDRTIAATGGIDQYPVKLTGKTGLHPDAGYTEKAFEGFTTLYYEPEVIAADGSTVFEVYYERNYYLMEFDCNGGFGTDTLYVRYGTYISVPNPVRSGWGFAGWNEGAVKLDNEGNPVKDSNGRIIIDYPLPDNMDDFTGDPLPASMPAANSYYRAEWRQANTTYSVAYWIVNDDGTRTFLGSQVKPGTTDLPVSGVHDLGTEAEGGPVICGSVNHTHTDECYTCGFTTEHKHTEDCIDNTLGFKGGNKPENGVNAIKDLENGGDPESGYIYVIYNHDSKTYWPKLYLEDSYGVGDYYVAEKYQGGDNKESFSAIIDGEALAEKNGNYGTETLTTTKYRPKTSCGLIQHVHDNACRPCRAHTHSAACYQDEKRLEEVDTITIEKEDGTTVTYTTDENVTIKGDGSSVVNVYYQYKEYTLKFYYAATTGGTETDNDSDASTYDTIKIVGGTTYYFGFSGPNSSDDETLLENEYWNYSGQWGEISALPSLNQTGLDRQYTSGSVTYTHDNTDVTYHYISFKARYGDDISNLWPCAVFNSATRTDKDNTNGWSGAEAFVSAWNGEHHVAYSRNPNQTIKGIYERLDENILFHSAYTDETEVSYLCFWENGANIGWSVPELYRYNIWVQALNSEVSDDGNGNITHKDGLPVVLREGIYYKCIDSYDTCDNSTVGEQTQVALTGYTQKTFAQNSYDGYKYWQINNSDPAEYFEYKTLTKAENAEELQQHGYFDGTLYSEGYEVNFYYTANSHSLQFWNHNGWLEEGKGAGNTEEGGGVMYGTPLNVFGNYVNAPGFMEEHYPNVLEPGAYEFAGWYTTDQCLEGTEVNWNTPMPDADLTLYAKWSPKVHNVYFYYDYQAYKDRNPWDGYNSYPIKVTHGQLLDTDYNKIPTANPGYSYIGWFYIDHGEKKKFAPDTMEVNKELHLFAEWQTKIDTEYSVTYVLDKDAEIGGTTYLANTPIASKTEGHLTVGKTKTFEAKSGMDLFAEFQNKSLFPTANSHSILMQPDKAVNQYQFRYVYDEEVWYKVRYVNKITGADLLDPKTEITDHAIVTEKFIPITGYLPEDYYIRKVMASDGEEGSQGNISAQNEIIFYYTPDEDHGVYIIEYYTENLDGSWYLEQSEIVTEDLMKEDEATTVSVTVDADKFNGFTYKESEVTQYGADGELSKTNSEETNLSGTLSEYGLEFRIYYKRNSYDYIVEYREYGTSESAAPLFTKKDSGKFEETVSWSLIDENADPKRDDIIYQKDGKTYRYYDDKDPDPRMSIEIRAFEEGAKNPNKIVFWYNQKKIELQYYAVWKETLPEGESAGFVSISRELVGATNPAGADAFAADGFRFVGWYMDKECKQSVDAGCVTGTKLVPEPYEDDDWINEYYALFEPEKENLTITKVGDKLSDDTFLFRVTGTDKIGNAVNLMVSIQGAGSVTIKDLYCGTYTVTELTNWSWTYSCTDASQEVTLTTEDKDTEGNLLNQQITTYGVTFANTPKTVDWLHGESKANENQFTNAGS